MAGDDAFGAYDVRGVVPEQLDAGLVHSLGRAFVDVLGPDRVVVGHDMRPSSPELAEAFARGAAGAGADVVSIGLAATDEVYFASGTWGAAGAMITASHNPARYNGVKLCRPGARPVGQGTGLSEIRDATRANLRGPAPGPLKRQGRVETAEVLDDYADRLLSLAPVAGRPLKVVVDAGNGMAGRTAPAVLGRLADVELIGMYLDLDGSFPNHPANPLEPANVADLCARVVAERADIGLAFDGDADRCFVVDERGEPVPGSALTSLLAAAVLAGEPGAAIVHNLITGRAVTDVVAALGGRAVRTRVGHSFLKQAMAESGAPFGGEHSGHFYFRDFWGADCGMLAALHVLAVLAAGPQPLSAHLAPYLRYPASGEINSVVADPGEVLQRLDAAYAGALGTTRDHLDGLTVDHEDWWFNVRPSNTEPLLRLNVEARDASVLRHLRDQVLAQIRSQP